MILAIVSNRRAFGLRTVLDVVICASRAERVKVHATAFLRALDFCTFFTTTHRARRLEQSRRDRLFAANSFRLVGEQIARYTRHPLCADNVRPFQLVRTHVSRRISLRRLIHKRFRIVFKSGQLLGSGRNHFFLGSIHRRVLLCLHFRLLGICHSDVFYIDIFHLNLHLSTRRA